MTGALRYSLSPESCMLGILNTADDVGEFRRLFSSHVLHMRFRCPLDRAKPHVVHWDSNYDVIGVDENDCTESVIVPSSVDVESGILVNLPGKAAATL
jgi:hypothetical protein